MIPAETLAFHRGALCALAVVAAADEETLYRDIVNNVGAHNLIAACEPGDREFSGLVKYGYCKPTPGGTDAGE